MRASVRIHLHACVSQEVFCNIFNKKKTNDLFLLSLLSSVPKKNRISFAIEAENTEVRVEAEEEG